MRRGSGRNKGAVMWLTSSSLSTNSRSSIDRSGGVISYGIAPLTRVLGHSIRTSSRITLLWRGSRSICGSQIAMSRSRRQMFRHTSPLSFSRSNSLEGLSSLRQIHLRSSQRRPIGTFLHNTVLISGISNTYGLQRTKSLLQRRRLKLTSSFWRSTLSLFGASSISGHILRMLPLNQTHQYTSLRSTLALLGKRSTFGLLRQTNRSLRLMSRLISLRSSALQSSLGGSFLSRRMLRQSSRRTRRLTFLLDSSPSRGSLSTSGFQRRTSRLLPRHSRLISSFLHDILRLYSSSTSPFASSPLS